jgi:hypothetical protein
VILELSDYFPVKLLCEKMGIQRSSFYAWKKRLLEPSDITGEKSVQEEINDYITFFNEQRPAYSLNYLTPKQFKEAFSSF